MLGKRVRELLVDNADRVQFFHLMWPTLTPKSIFLNCWKNEAFTVSQRWLFWMPWNHLSGLWSLGFMRDSKRRHSKEFRCVIVD